MRLEASRWLTDQLHNSQEPRWKRLRERLSQEGIAPEDGAICDLHDEDVSREFGLIVTRQDRAFWFYFDFRRDESGRETALEDARVIEWRELDNARKDRYEKELEAGKAVLNSKHHD
jgi:hypothetical protein